MLLAWTSQVIVRRAAFAAIALSMIVGSVFFSRGVPAAEELLAATAIAALGVIVGRWQRPTVKAGHRDNSFAVDQNSRDSAISQTPQGGSESDLGEQVARLQSIAARDPLTGLSNRAGLETFIEDRLRASEPGSPHCLLFIDIDGFKQVNDVLGHSQGDKLLALLAERLKIVARHDLFDDGENVAVARFGGDEFVIFVANSGSGNAAQKLANRIIRILSDPFQLGSKSIQIGASIGVAFAPDHGNDFRELIRKADVAMYQAKSLGKNRCEFYRDSLLDADLPPPSGPYGVLVDNVHSRHIRMEVERSGTGGRIWR